MNCCLSGAEWGENTKEAGRRYFSVARCSFSSNFCPFIALPDIPSADATCCDSHLTLSRAGSFAKVVLALNRCKPLKVFAVSRAERERIRGREEGREGGREGNEKRTKEKKRKRDGVTAGRRNE
jgi:hypothetical protein